MTDQPMDGFDARLTYLMTAYGDRAVTAHDAAAIARVAATRAARACGSASGSPSMWAAVQGSSCSPPWSRCWLWPRPSRTVRRASVL
jgi:hypothetical protein